MLKQIMLVWCGFAIPFTVCADKISLSVMDFPAKEVSPEQARMMTTTLIAELKRFDNKYWYALVVGDQRDKLMQEWPSKHPMCYDSFSCVAGFGRALGVQKMLYGVVAKEGRKLSLKLLLVDVPMERGENWWSREYNGKEKTLPDLISSLVSDAVNSQVEATMASSDASRPVKTTRSPAQLLEGLNVLGVNSQGFKEYLNPKDSSTLILIPAGQFIMGSNDSSPEKPVHSVVLDDYLIGKYEVSNLQYKRFCDATSHPYPPDPNFKSTPRAAMSISPPAPGLGDYFTKYPDCPVVYITWADASAYCDWAGLRLPTEAEWEKAARGADARKYPWGNKFDCDKCNFADRNAPERFWWANPFLDDSYTYPASVTRNSKGPSPYQAMDMAGNVWEWCSDWYFAKFYALGSTKNPCGPESGDGHVVRGGGWDSYIFLCRTTNRDMGRLGHKNNNLGFRVAR